MKQIQNIEATSPPAFHENGNEPNEPTTDASEAMAVTDPSIDHEIEFNYEADASAAFEQALEERPPADAAPAEAVANPGDDVPSRDDVEEPPMDEPTSAIAASPLQSQETAESEASALPLLAIDEIPETFSERRTVPAEPTVFGETAQFVAEQADTDGSAPQPETSEGGDAGSAPATDADSDAPAADQPGIDAAAGDVDAGAPAAGEAETSGGKQRAPAEPMTAERLDALEEEVTAAPHKVYSLGKVRRAIGGAKGGDEESLAFKARLKALDALITAQIGERKAAKEAICERAETMSTSTEWKSTGEKMKGLFEEWKLIGAAGRELDDKLWLRFVSARELFSKARSTHFEERQATWAASQAKKETLCAEAEALVDSSDWRGTAEKIRDLQAQWKEAGSSGRESDEALWTRFNQAKQVFFDRRTETWAASAEQKEALIAEANSLKESTDWRGAADAMKAMQARWKEIGSAGKAQEDDLWQRFRAATQVFFERRSATFDDRRNEERENLAKKQDLVAKAEALASSTDVLAASREVKDLQAQWKLVGPAPRESADALWNRFRTACDGVFESGSDERDRMQTEWQVRMKDAMSKKRVQLLTVRESIVTDENNLARWRDMLATRTFGGSTKETESSLDAKIFDAIAKIRDKNIRVEELRATIVDMDAKMKD